MRLLSVQDVLYIHSRIIATSGGSYGLRDGGALESSVAPMQSFDGTELYSGGESCGPGVLPRLKPPFVDGNKRVAHAALVVMLRLNGYSLVAPVDFQEKIMLALASGKLTRSEFQRGF